MKIDRLLGIINILTQGERVTAPQLAERFEVSRRTINRDIEDICQAGIPVVTQQGAGGGMYIDEGYKLNKKLLKTHELEHILAGLRGLHSISAGDEIAAILDKFSAAGADENEGIIQIDLASFYKTSLSGKIEKLKKAISEKCIVEFTYYGKAGEHVRRIEPYVIVFKWSDWYVLGYCLYKDDFRMFKLKRLWDLHVTDETYEARQVPEDRYDFDAHLTDEHKFTAVFDAAVKYRLVEEYGPESFTQTDEGRLLFEGGYTNREHIVSWILGFGDSVQVTEPQDLAKEVKALSESIYKKYE